ncbi:MAG: hypothetical protein LZF86_110188 [Nitrospira sp.]|nr:MAG: hypothetical protein LZF86_110188 [Nitrospira sp.]
MIQAKVVVLSSLVFALSQLNDSGRLNDALARALDFESYSMISSGMTEVDVLSRAGEPDKKMRVGKAPNQYSWIWLGDPKQDEWTTVVSFSSVTKLVIEVSRTQR